MTAIYVPYGKAGTYKEKNDWDSYKDKIQDGTGNAKWKIGAANGSGGTYDVTAYLDSEDTLNIEGTGSMKDFANKDDQPWRNSRNSIIAVKIDKDITHIGNHAFDVCSSLATVAFAESSRLQTIGNKTFTDCEKLTGLKIPVGVTEIGYDAFNGCKKLANVTFTGGSELQIIGARAFKNCKALSSIEIPSMVTSIGQEAFCNCSNLATVEFLATAIQEIKSDIFDDCTALTTIKVPAGKAFDYKKVANLSEYKDKIVVTVADVLATVPDGFPTDEEAGWVNANGKKVYNNGINITFLSNKSLDTVLQKDGSNYKYSDSVNGASYIFVMTDEVLTSIIVSGSRVSDFDGEYVPYVEPEPTPTYHGGYVHVETAAERHAKLVEVAETQLAKTEIKSKTKLTKLNGKKAVKISWSVTDGDFALLDFDGFDVFRSTKKYSGYGNTPYFTTTKTTYKNNKDLEKGKTYYYKVRAYKMVDGEKVYTGWSTKAWRTIK